MTTTESQIRFRRPEIGSRSFKAFERRILHLLGCDRRDRTQDPRTDRRRVSSILPLSSERPYERVISAKNN